MQIMQKHPGTICIKHQSKTGTHVPNMCGSEYIFENKFLTIVTGWERIVTNHHWSHAKIDVVVTCSSSQGLTLET